jgi:hypothetical protein
MYSACFIDTYALRYVCCKSMAGTVGAQADVGLAGLAELEGIQRTGASPQREIVWPAPSLAALRRAFFCLSFSDDS